VTPIDVPIEHIVVVGGGIVGWSAAVALRRRVPGVAVTIVATPPPSDALADRIAQTLPSTIGFHDDLGLSEDDAVLRAGGVWRLGTEFADWAAGRAPYVHAYGPCGQPFGTASFHHHWLRAAREGTAAPFDAHAPAAVLARAGRMPVPPTGIVAEVQAALMLDVPRYRAMLEAFARHLGVAVRDGEVATVRMRDENGFVDAIVLTDGTAVTADVFVDASGPGAIVRGAIDGEWEDWQRWLRCDRLITGDGAPERLNALDHVHAMPAGWRWRSSTVDRTSHGMCYASAFLSEAEAQQALTTAGATTTAPAVAFRQGTRPRPWARNCVAIGDAATVIEPLDFTNLHLAHSAIDRIVAMLPGRACHPLEIADYNRQAQAEVARVRDFVLCHYATAQRPEPFWRDPDALPDSLAHTLAAFLERGRLPFFEEETFSRDDWLTVLLGQGTMPRRIDPLIETTDAADSDRAMAAYRAAIGQAVSLCPDLDPYFHSQRKRLGR
jgi:tryptophan halogenase